MDLIVDVFRNCGDPGNGQIVHLLKTVDVKLPSALSVFCFCSRLFSLLLVSTITARETCVLACCSRDGALVMLGISVRPGETWEARGTGFPPSRGQHADAWPSQDCWWFFGRLGAGLCSHSYVLPCVLGSRRFLIIRKPGGPASQARPMIWGPHSCWPKVSSHLSILCCVLVINFYLSSFWSCSSNTQRAVVLSFDVMYVDLYLEFHMHWYRQVELPKNFCEFLRINDENQRC